LCVSSSSSSTVRMANKIPLYSTSKVLSGVMRLKKDLSWKGLVFRLFATSDSYDNGELKGVDEFGNKYYEDLDAQVFRQRYVLFKDFYPQPSSIPAEWHGWMVSSDNQTVLERQDSLVPFYSLPHLPMQNSKMGAASTYYPPGAYNNPNSDANRINHPSVKPKYTSWSRKMAL
jgi:NADH:ubiquinone oxidoreductase subunit